MGSVSGGAVLPRVRSRVARNAWDPGTWASCMGLKGVISGRFLVFTAGWMGYHSPGTQAPSATIAPIVPLGAIFRCRHGTTIPGLWFQNSTGPSVPPPTVQLFNVRTSKTTAPEMRPPYSMFGIVMGLLIALLFAKATHTPNIYHHWRGITRLPPMRAPCSCHTEVLLGYLVKKETQQIFNYSHCVD